MIGSLLILLGLLLFVLGYLGVIIDGFRSHILWGLALIFCTAFGGIIYLVFVILHWRDAKDPFITSIIGLFLIFLGRVIG
jgi:cytochrome c oxidase subunit IV